MLDTQRPDFRPIRAFLRRFFRDHSGSTIPLVAAFLIPLFILSGVATDTSRMYLVKVRLQQACDAGVLAGRKYMTATTGTSLDEPAMIQANAFFNNNFRAGWVQTSNVTFTPVRSADGQVQATATATLPMTLMKMFNFNSVSVSANCTARLDIGDSDIMFVLDTTGSMACLTSDGTAGCGQTVSTYTRPDGTTSYYTVEKSGSKLQGLRDAVMSFYDTLAAHVPPDAHIRYGFVTYTSTVNAGYLLPASSIVDSWPYQSRQVIGDVNNSAFSATSVTYTGKTQTACNGYASRVPATGYTTNGTAVVNTVSWTSSSGGTCKVTSQPVKPNWQYTSVTYDVSQYKTGATVTDPSKITGATTKWQGCLEERDTTVSTSFDQANLPADLNPDLPATSTSTRWRPTWPEVIYYRGSGTGAVTNSGSSTSPYGDSTNSAQFSQFTSVMMPIHAANGFVSCGKPAQRLATMSRSQVYNYVYATDFKAMGGTYHDTGMIWGTRLISPQGMFAADTAAWPGNNPPNRYIVFMTDGDMSPSQYTYGMYGLELYDRRVTGGASSPAIKDFHNARFLTECSAAKARNITVFVVGFGQSLTPELTTCATPGFAYQANDNAGLQTIFSKIALQVAQLRLSQ